MIPQYGYRGLISDQNDQTCACGMCVPIASAWSELSNTEKLAKMIILKAQVAAEINAYESK